VFDLAKEMPNYDYWIAKTYILLADNYRALKDNFQAKATLQSIIDNYKADDEILPTAKQQLQAINGGKAIKAAETVAPETDTPAAPADTTKTPTQN
jgi:Flp pilus assembly protein TadD